MTVPADVVAICTPSGLHPKQGIMAAKRGLHVICEKPMATRLEEADALVKACDDAGVHLFVVKQNRLNPSIQLLKRSLDAGASAASISRTPPCAGTGRSRTTTWRRGAARGSSTAARS